MSETELSRWSAWANDIISNEVYRSTLDNQYQYTKAHETPEYCTGDFINFTYIIKLIQKASSSQASYQIYQAQWNEENGKILDEQWSQLWEGSDAYKAATTRLTALSYLCEMEDSKIVDGLEELDRLEEVD